jgi:uncharacterized protein (DUF2132 family)
MNASNDPLHGKKLADILDELLDYYGGFEGLSRKIEIRPNCVSDMTIPPTPKLMQDFRQTA